MRSKALINFAVTGQLICAIVFAYVKSRFSHDRTIDFSGSDGLIKLWTIKSNECVKTLDEHEDKLWAVAVSKTEEKFISGGADSTLIEWKVT